MPPGPDRSSRKRPLNVEFPATPLRSDLLFEAMDENGRLHLLHYELQGRTSHKAMPYRELEYMSRVTIREIPLPLGAQSPRLHSVVLYIGEGAGRGDTGQYTVYGLDDQVALQWRYQPVRLWEMTAETLLQLELPALTALVGLTRLQQPEQELPQALSRIRSVADAEQRQRLLTALVSLLPTEEVTKMVESLLEESETLLLDTPYLRRMREKGREEGIQIGREEGREEGLREAILEAVVRRFNPPAADYFELQRRLETIHQPERLQQLLLAMFDVRETAVLLDLIRNFANSPDPGSKDEQ